MTQCWGYEASQLRSSMRLSNHGMRSDLTQKKRKAHGLLATGGNVLAGRWPCKEGHAAGERHRRFCR